LPERFRLVELEGRLVTAKHDTPAGGETDVDADGESA